MYNIFNILGRGVWHVAECPFLSTFENEIECFKECALYEWKENGGLCPFKNLSEFRLHKVSDFDDFSSVDRELSYLKDSYLERQDDYIKL
jgi:hypothetical protein